GVTMALVIIVRASAYGRNVHDSARRPSYRIDPERSGFDRQRFWFRAMAGASAGVKRSFRLGGSSTLARSAYGDRYRRRGAGPGTQNRRLSQDLRVGGKNRATFSHDRVRRSVTLPRIRSNWHRTFR